MIERVLFVLHVAAGAIALSSFAIPLLARKGGRAHRRAGWVYACAMGLAAVSAWGLCAHRLADERTENDRAALFLAFVGLLAANTAGTGLRAIRTKARAPGRAAAIDVGSSVVLLACAGGLGALAIVERSVLFGAFAALGVFVATGQLRFWLRPPATRMPWLFAHFVNMLAACIGTVTAFLVVNASRLGLGDYAVVLWIAPGVLGGIAITLLSRHYRRALGAERKE
jgi:hypothetical protein